MIASRAFAVQTLRHWRKLTVAEVRSVLRAGFTEWQTLPDAVQTDHELGLTGSPNDPFPSVFTLWLVGLGIEHLFSRPRRPTDQAQVERNHRTLDDFALDAAALTDLASLQQALDRERHQHNHEFPSRASDCAGRPPLTAHPALLHPRRPYRPEYELALFDLQRVGEYLARFTFERKVNASGQVSLGRRRYSVGRQYAGQELIVRFDCQAWQWIFRTKSEEEVARRSPKGLDIQTLTGLDPEDYQPAPPIQLLLPGILA